MNTERVTLREAAELTGRHRNTVRAWVRAGKFTTAALEDRDDGGQEWRLDATELEALGLLATSEPGNAQTRTEETRGGTLSDQPAATQKSDTEPEPAHAPVPEGMQLIPAATLERLVAIAASYAEAGERIGRAEAEAAVYRERLDEARAEAEGLRAELEALRAGREPQESRAEPSSSPAVGDRVRAWWRRVRP